MLVEKQAVMRVEAWPMAAGLAAAAVYSVWLRVSAYRKVKPLELETRVSPLSLAIQDLIAVAGGIYLAILMIVSFLKIDVPEKVFLHQVSFDPLALAAVGLTILQPIVLRLWKGR